MDRLSTLALVLVTLVTMLTVVSGTRCYMCRDVVQRSGNRRMFKEKYALMRDNGWINPCSDESFVVYPQVGCVKRTYFTNEMCLPNKKCIVKVTERYPDMPPQMTKGIHFFKKLLAEEKVKEEKHCQSDLCNGNYNNQHMVGLKCYHQCGSIKLYGLTEQELAEYHLPVIPCDGTTYNYCGADMECGYIVGSAVYTDNMLQRDITVVGWFADCFYKDNDSIDHVLQTVRVMMKDHPSLQISPDDLTKCGTELCNIYID